jgi:ribonuclease VapC
MFVDTSAVIAIICDEPEADDLILKMQAANYRCTSPLVVLEATMRLTSKLSIDPLQSEQLVERLLSRSRTAVIPIEEADGRLAVQAFRDFGKGRGHPAQLNLADCLSYACAKNRGFPLLYKGDDFARTDLASA